MAQGSPVLSSRVEIFRNVITHGNSKLEILSSDSGTKHGKNASCLIFDETHTFPNRELYDAMATSQGARAQPLNISITTAGHDRESLCWELHSYAEKVRDGIVDDHAFLPCLFSANIDADWKDPKVWRKCNPSLGVTIHEDFLTAECEKAKEISGFETTFRQLYLCQWTQSKRTWITADSWNKCESSTADKDSLRGRECYLGLDLSTNTDLTALALIFPNSNGSVDVLTQAWCPEEGVLRRSRSDRAPYDVWVRKGHLISTPGSVVDYDFVADYIRQCCVLYEVKSVGYDPWNATQLSTGLYTEGVPMIEVRQGYRTLSEPSKKLEALVVSKKLRHNGNDLLNWCVSNAVIDTDPAGNIKPSKATSTERIDALAALVTALAAWMHKENTNSGPSVYEERDLTWL